MGELPQPRHALRAQDLPVPLGAGAPRYAIHVEAAPEAVADADPARAVATLNAAIEAIARRDFSQYQWTYKRYTLRPPGSGEDNPYLDLYR